MDPVERLRSGSNLSGTAGENDTRLKEQFETGVFFEHDCRRARPVGKKEEKTWQQWKR